MVTGALDGDGDVGIVLLGDVGEPGLARTVNKWRVMDFARGRGIDFLQPRNFGGLHLVSKLAPLFFAGKHTKADLDHTLLLRRLGDACVLYLRAPASHEPVC